MRIVAAQGRAQGAEEFDSCQGNRVPTYVAKMQTR